MTGYYLLRGKRYTPPGAGLGAGPGHGGGCKESGELFQLFEHGHGYKAAELIKFGKSPWRTKTFYSDSYYAIRFVKDGPTGVSLDNGRLNHEVLYSEVLPLLRYRSSCYVYAIPDVIVGAEPLTALSRDEVQSIVDRFQSLNPYDQKLGSILKIHKLNWDCSKNRRQLFGIGIAAKRYALYTKSKRDIQIVEPKAHGLGYFYAPKDSREAWDADSPEWIFEAWAWIVRGQLGLKRSNPAWFNLPVMMRLTLSTPHHALKNLAKGPLTRPHNFMMMPQISRFGCPQGVDPDKFTLITAFCSERNQWMQSKCINVHDPDSPMYELSDEYDGRRAVPKNFFMLLESYQNHPEAKSVGPDGKPCGPQTRGLLGRAHITANWPPVYIGKEHDRHFEQGEDLTLLDFQVIQYRRKGNAVATDEQLERIAGVPKREFIRRGIKQHTLEKICKRVPVRAGKLEDCLRALEEYEALAPYPPSNK